MISLNIAFPLLYWENTILITGVCLTKLFLETITISQEKKNVKTTIFQTIILNLISNYIGFLLIVLPEQVGVSIPFLLSVCPPPQFLDLTSLLLSILLPSIINAFLAKKVFFFSLKRAFQIGLCAAISSTCMILTAALQFLNK
jgi:hypothetical protein